jgi:hypothetical protein
VEDVVDLYHGRGAFEACSRMKMSKQIPIGGALTRSVDKNSGKSPVSGSGTCASPLAMPCREKNSAMSSGHRPKNARPLSQRPTRYQRRMAPGSGPKGEAEARSGGVLSRCKRMEPCAVRQARRSGSANCGRKTLLRSGRFSLLL